MTNEEILSDYMRRHYTDEKLAALLAHAEDGKLSLYSCCCFIGIPTADHALRETVKSGGVDLHDAVCAISKEPHYAEARGSLSDENEAFDAESAFAELAGSDEGRRAKLIPLVREEMSRREGLRNVKAELSELGEALQEVTV